MRIGTWNVDARWDDRHQTLVMAQRCDVWLLTEIPDRANLPGFECHLTAGCMARGQHWAGVFAPELVPLPEPDVATAAARVANAAVWSSVLPWVSSGPSAPWSGERHDDRIRSAVASLRENAPPGEVVWGGDWNHTLQGRVVGSHAGRGCISELAESLGLQVATAALPHQIDGVHSIDHVAVPSRWEVRGAERVSAAVDGKLLSDHDAYVIDVVRR